MELISVSGNCGAITSAVSFAVCVFTKLRPFCIAFVKASMVSPFCSI
jgi:hypothetical protein